MKDTYDMAKLMARIKQTIGEEKYHLQSAVKHILHMDTQLREVCQENESLRELLTEAVFDGSTQGNDWKDRVHELLGRKL